MVVKMVDIYKNKKVQDDKGNWVTKPFYLCSTRAKISEEIYTKIENRGIVQVKTITMLIDARYKDYVIAGNLIKIGIHYKTITSYSVQNGTVNIKIQEVM